MLREEYMNQLQYVHVYVKYKYHSVKCSTKITNPSHIGCFV